MPIPIIIAILVALFTLGAKMNQQPKSSSAKVVIIGGKQYNQIDKKEAGNTLEVKAPQQSDNTITIKAQRETGSFENIFQLFGLYQIIKTEPMNVLKQSINSNISQAVNLAEKE